MKAKKSKGAARPSKASAVPARRLFLTDRTFNAVSAARAFYGLATWNETARTLLNFAAYAGTLTPDFGPGTEAPDRAPARGTSDYHGEQNPLRSFRLGARLDRRMCELAKASGLSLAAACALALDWTAPRAVAAALQDRENSKQEGVS